MGHGEKLPFLLSKVLTAFSFLETEIGWYQIKRVFPTVEYSNYGIKEEAQQDLLSKNNYRCRNSKYPTSRVDCDVFMFFFSTNFQEAP